MSHRWFTFYSGITRKTWLYVQMRHSWMSLFDVVVTELRNCWRFGNSARQTVNTFYRQPSVWLHADALSVRDLRCLCFQASRADCNSKFRPFYHSTWNIQSRTETDRFDTQDATYLPSVKLIPDGPWILRDRNLVRKRSTDSTIEKRRLLLHVSMRPIWMEHVEDVNRVI
jgi:hypothetical protein